MKTLIALTLIVIASSCNTATTVKEKQIIEGCEYIVTTNVYGNGLTHKGNCKNPIHKCTCNN